MAACTKNAYISNMESTATSPDTYIQSLPEDRQLPIIKLREQLNNNLPKGFEEAMSYGMIGWVVPHSLYPAGYHCDPKLPLPFISIASQKNHIAFYHMGLYASQSLKDWFYEQYPKATSAKLDMGKSCIRFKNPEQIPYELLGHLSAKMKVEEWIELYESNIARKK